MIENRTLREYFFDPSAWHRTDRPNRICRRWFTAGVEVELRYASGRWTWRVRNLDTNETTKNVGDCGSMRGAMESAFREIGGET
ncbi:MAG: hypothetical protein RIC55_28380 [Pirellulaceae bacterium]